MSFRFGTIRLVAASCAVLLASAGTRAAAVQAEHVSVNLISEVSALQAGKTAWLGLHLRHDPHWHSYWINPGDSGLPTRLKWTLPDGYTAEEIDWPAPARFEISGLYNFGYADEIVLPVAIHVPQSAVPGELAAFSVEASWLVCREECITGKATLDLDLPITASEASRADSNHALFLASREMKPAFASWSGEAQMEGNQIEIRLEGDGLPPIENLDVFAVERSILGNAPPLMRREGDTLVIVADKNDYFDQAPDMLELVLTSRMTNGRTTAWQVRVPFVAGSASP